MLDKDHKPKPSLVREANMPTALVQVWSIPNGTAMLRTKLRDGDVSERQLPTLEAAQMEFHRVLARLYELALAQPPACPACGEGRE